MKWFLRNERGKKIVFLGDSITFDGRYAAKIKKYFDVYAPWYGFEIVNCGLSSENVSGLSEPDHPFPRPCALDRADSVLKSEKPDVVVFCYGMNDGIYYPFSEERFKRFKDGLEALISKISDFGADIVIMTPPPFDYKSNREIKVLPETAEKFSYMEPYEGYDGVLEKYSKYVMSLEKDSRIKCCIDLHTPLRGFIDEKRLDDADYSFSDSIHPKEEGHALMAKIILKQLINVTLTADVGEFADGEYHGFERKNFYFEGREASFILPEKFAEGRPWIWRAEFLGAFDGADVKMLENGWGLAYINLSDMYGSDEAAELMEKFRREIVKKFGLREKGVLFGFSRGGLYSVNYAYKYPASTAGLYLDAPVLDIYSWPAGMGSGCGTQASPEWEECKILFGASAEGREENKTAFMEKIKKICGEKIPVMLVAGGADSVVPYNENGRHLADYYMENGGVIETVVQSWKDHHPHSLENVYEIVDFIMKFMN